MTRVWYSPGEYRLRAQGHAGSAKIGEDLICAGVSALMWALVDTAAGNDGYHSEVLIEPPEALMQVKCKPDAGQEGSCRTMYETIVNGIKVIADASPEHVRFMIGG